MDYLAEYEDDIFDEICSAKKYAMWGIKLKDTQPEYAKKMKQMALDELDHYQNLDSLARKMIEDDTTQHIYDHMHNKHMEKVAEAKYYISQI